tara:strand:- start:21 stop:266 length:246 start_codon:yes stop_codon:yes gene_type:complete
MSKDSKTKTCYRGIMFKLSKIEDQINRVSRGISELKQKFAQDMDPNEEYCIDEIDSQSALLESVEEMYVTSLLEREPEGDA